MNHDKREAGASEHALYHNERSHPAQIHVRRNIILFCDKKKGGEYSKFGRTPSSYHKQEPQPLGCNMKPWMSRQMSQNNQLSWLDTNPSLLTQSTRLPLSIRTVGTTPESYIYNLAPVHLYRAQILNLERVSPFRNNQWITIPAVLSTRRRVATRPYRGSKEGLIGQIRHFPACYTCYINGSWRHGNVFYWPGIKHFAGCFRTTFPHRWRRRRRSSR